MPQARHGVQHLFSRSVTRGPDEPLPEKRFGVREGLIDRLLSAPTGAVRQDYTNGEFIVHSLIVSTTQEGASRRDLELDGAGPTVHYDPALTVYWRQGGCWD